MISYQDKICNLNTIINSIVELVTQKYKVKKSKQNIFISYLQNSSFLGFIQDFEYRFYWKTKIL